MPLYALPYDWNNSGNLKFYQNVSILKHALRESLFDEIIESIEN